MENPVSPLRPHYGSGALARRSGCWIRLGLELVVFSALILGTRCANFRDVFVEGKIYFVDADCYARMTRARLVSQHRGLVVRRHDFENFPVGITPHTTAPLDYLIVALAALLRPLTTQPLDLAGALVAPLLALAGGWFLYWWVRDTPATGRWAVMLVYSLSGILAHGTALGRPDHQALLIVILLVALVAESELQLTLSRAWSIASGLSWGLALWVSLYEPLVLLVAMLIVLSARVRSQLWAPQRRTGWFILGGIVLLAALVERRWPSWPAGDAFFAHWSATVGELEPVRLTNRIWLEWGGGFLLLAPFLLPVAWWRRTLSLTIACLLVLSFLLTCWQARWSYVFVLLLVLTLPAQMAVVRPAWLAGLTITLSLWPVLHFWDGEFWPNEEAAARRAQDRRAAVAWRAAADSLGSATPEPILTPWWLAPPTAYWSGQPTVAGSAHESLSGIVDSARFFLANSAAETADILRRREVRWVVLGDGDEAVENSSAVLGVPVPEAALGWTLDRWPSRAPHFLLLRSQVGTAKVYRVQGLAPVKKPGLPLR